ncbi:MAG: YfbM family protein [Polyangiales bacterium]
MGMYASLFLLSDANQRRVLEEPLLFEQLLGTEQESPKQSFWSRLFGELTRAPARLQFQEHEGGRFELDKAWHALHFLLTGSATGGEPPLSLLVSARGGTELQGAGDDYGPPRLFSSDVARRAHEALQALADDALLARFDPAAMMAAEIYPEVWDRPGEGPEWLLESLHNLREALRKAAEHRLGVAVCLG